MAEHNFIIEYTLIENVSFPSSTGMKKYLESEAKVWSPFMEGIRSQLPGMLFRSGGSVNPEALASAFDTLVDRLEDNTEFNRSTQRFHGDIALPPPSESLEGQLILGLNELGRVADAVSVYVWFIVQSLDIRTNTNNQIPQMTKRGAELAVGAYAAAALPFRKVTSQKLAGALRSADAQVQSLGEEVESAQLTNAEHAEKLSDLRSNWRKRAKRIEGLIVRRERLRRNTHDQWVQGIDDEVESRFANAEIRLAALDRANEAKQKKAIVYLTNPWVDGSQNTYFASKMPATITPPQ